MFMTGAPLPVPDRATARLVLFHGAAADPLPAFQPPLRINFMARSTTKRASRGWDEINIPVESQLPLFPQPLGNIGHFFNISEGDSFKPPVMFKQKGSDVMKFRRFNTDITEYPFKTQFYNLLRLSDHIGVILLFEKQIEDIKPNHGLSKITLGQAFVTFIETLPELSASDKSSCEGGRSPSEFKIFALWMSKDGIVHEPLGSEGTIFHRNRNAIRSIRRKRRWAY